MLFDFVFELIVNNLILGYPRELFIGIFVGLVLLVLCCIGCLLFFIIRFIRNRKISLEQKREEKLQSKFVQWDSKQEQSTLSEKDFIEE